MNFSKMAEGDWKDLLQKLQSAKDVIVINHPPVNTRGEFVCSKNISFEHKGVFYYCECYPREFTITPYIKHNPFEWQQGGAEKVIRSYQDFWTFVGSEKELAPYQGAIKQKVYLTELPERDILELYNTSEEKIRKIIENLKNIEIVTNLYNDYFADGQIIKDRTIEYKFTAKNGEYFIYDTGLKEIVDDTDDEYEEERIA